MEGVWINRTAEPEPRDRCASLPIQAEKKCSKSGWWLPSRTAFTRGEPIREDLLRGITSLTGLLLTVHVAPRSAEFFKEESCARTGATIGIPRFNADRGEEKVACDLGGVDPVSIHPKPSYLLTLCPSPADGREPSRPVQGLVGPLPRVKTFSSNTHPNPSSYLGYRFLPVCFLPPFQLGRA
jgi:hypothetical protein